MSHSFGIVIESLVAVLLVLTIGYCMLLNKRLKRLKADEHSLKATIGGTDHGDRNRRARDRRAQAYRARRQRESRQPAHRGDADVGASEGQLAEGDGVVRRLSRIAIAARPPSARACSAPEPKLSTAKAVAAAAEAFSERRRASGLAA